MSTTAQQKQGATTHPIHTWSPTSFLPNDSFFIVFPYRCIFHGPWEGVPREEIGREEVWRWNKLCFSIAFFKLDRNTSKP